MYLDTRKPVFEGLKSNSGADKPVHRYNQKSVFVIRFIESIVCHFATGEHSFLSSLCSWGNWFETCFVRNPKDGVLLCCGPYQVAYWK